MRTSLCLITCVLNLVSGSQAIDLNVPGTEQDLSFSGTLSTNYGNGEISDPRGVATDRSFDEAVLDTDLSWGDFRLNTALAWANRAEFPDSRLVDSTRVQGASLIRASLEWQGPVLLRLGNIYTTFGRGHSLSLFRDDQLQNPLLERTSRDQFPTTWDNSIQGAYLEVLGDHIGVKALAGTSDYTGQLLGLNPELTRGAATLGLAWSAMDEVVLDPKSQGDFQEVENHEVYYSHYIGNWDIFLSHLEQHLDEESIAVAGSGGVSSYAAIGTSIGEWSLRGEYKYYRLSSELLRFSSPPIAQQEYPTRLIARKRKRVNHFDDEVGIQLEVQRFFSNGMELFLSRAQASRMDTEKDSPTYLPEMKESLAAYQEVTAVWQWEMPQERHLRLGAAWAEEAEPHTSEAASVYRNLGGAIGYSSPIPLLKSFEANLELLRREDLHHEEHQNLTLFYVDVFPFQGFSMNVTADFESRSLTAISAEEEALHRQWLGSTEARYDFDSKGDTSHSLTLFVGRLRGGLVCSSGNCRVVAPFSGVKFQYGLQF